MPDSVKFNGKEVQNPLLRILVVLLAVACLVALLFLVLPILGTLLMILVVLCILSVPLHYVLRAQGRKGFFSRNGNEFTWSLNKQAFERE